MDGYQQVGADADGADGIELYLAPGIADYAQQVTLSVSRFLWFRSLKATIALPDGITLGRRASLV